MSETDKSPWIIDTTDENFQADAVDSSYERACSHRLLGFLVPALPHANPEPRSRS